MHPVYTKHIHKHIHTHRDVKNVIKQIKNVKKRFLFRKNKKRYIKRIINCWVPVVRNYRNQHLLGAKQLQWPKHTCLRKGYYSTIDSIQLIHNAGDGQYPGYAFLCGQWNSRLSINKPL